jgi:hypothetical protein
MIRNFVIDIHFLHSGEEKPTYLCHFSYIALHLTRQIWVVVKRDPHKKNENIQFLHK